MRLRHGDALFAECVRTFATRDVDARAWLHRLEVQLQTVVEQARVVLVPPTVKPHIRNERIKPPYVDMYGFRPLAAPWMMWVRPSPGISGIDESQNASSACRSSAFETHR